MFQTGSLYKSSVHNHWDQFLQVVLRENTEGKSYHLWLGFFFFISGRVFLLNSFSRETAYQLSSLVQVKEQADFFMSSSRQQKIIPSHIFLQCLSYSNAVLPLLVVQIVNQCSKQGWPIPSHSLLQVTVLHRSMQNGVTELCGKWIAKETLMILENMRQSKNFRACFKAKIHLDLKYEYIPKNMMKL